MKKLKLRMVLISWVAFRRAMNLIFRVLGFIAWPEMKETMKVDYKSVC